MSRFIRFFFGALLGGFIFAAIALFLTPVSGKELRARIVAYFTSTTNDIRQAGLQRRIELEQELAVLRQPQPRD